LAEDPGPDINRFDLLALKFAAEPFDFNGWEQREAHHRTVRQTTQAERQGLAMRTDFRSAAAQLLLLSAVATCWLRADEGDPYLKSLLQKGIKRGYPGMAVLTQSADGRIQSAAVGYSDLENHVPMRVEDAFHWRASTRHLQQLPCYDWSTAVNCR